ncbi:MAG: GumC family protein [Bacteroidota bacterium]
MKSSNGVHGNRRGHSERTLSDYLAIIMRGKWIVLGTFACVLGITAIYSKLATPVYKSTATVLIDQKLPSTPVSLEGSGRSTLQNIKNELEVLKSRSIADTVAHRLIAQRYLDPIDKTPIPLIQPEEDKVNGAEFASPEEIIGRITSAVDFEPLRDTDVLKVMAQSNDPREAALLANLYAQAYYDRNIFASRSRSRALREFLEAQVRDKRGSLDVTESAMQEYMETQGIVSLDDESRKVITQLADLEATRDATEISLKSLTKTLASYKEQFPQQEADVAKMIGESNDQYIRGLQDQIAKLEVQRDVTIAQNPTFAGQDIYNQRLKEIDEQIDALKVKLRERTESFIQSLPAGRSAKSDGDPAGYLGQLKQNIVETEIEMQALQSKKKALDDVIRQYTVQFERIPKKSIQYARLQRAKMSNEKLFLLVESKYNEAAISERSEFGYITIMDPAVVPNSPASPKFMLNVLIGGLLGLTLGLAGVFVREMLDVKLQAPEDLKKRNWNVLAAVMVMDDELQRIGKDTDAPRFNRDVDPHLITLMLPFSPIAESYRLLRTTLHFPKGGEAPKTLLVTSASPGEGKTTTVCNLAVSIAQTGKRVLLVDCDLRKPNVHNLFNIPMKPGLAELLFKVGAHEMAVQTGVVKNLDVICSGALSPNPAEILGSREMRGFIEQAQREYDIILLDASPVLAATDASILSTNVDGVVIVTASGTTRVADVERTIEMIEGVGGKILGYVLNKLDLQRAYGISYGKRGYGYYGYAYQSSETNGKAGKHSKSRET